MKNEKIESRKLWRCSRCDIETSEFPALSRRNVGYVENGRLCNSCSELEAWVDMADDITPMIHWEFRFHQYCCGNATQDGHEEFRKFIAWRKRIGKHDPPLLEIEWMIHKKMFSGSIRKIFDKYEKSRIEEWIAKEELEHREKIKSIKETIRIRKELPHQEAKDNV